MKTLILFALLIPMSAFSGENYTITKVKAGTPFLLYTENGSVDQLHCDYPTIGKYDVNGDFEKHLWFKNEKVCERFKACLMKIEIHAESSVRIEINHKDKIKKIIFPQDC